MRDEIKIYGSKPIVEKWWGENVCYSLWDVYGGLVRTCFSVFVNGYTVFSFSCRVIFRGINRFMCVICFIPFYRVSS